MPTTHVTSDSESELQDIANALWKARKVVVITGAGISTNSGIPDFRSENGLYSLIQAQFDAAAVKEASGGRSSSASSHHGADEAEQDDRAPKKRRTPQDESSLSIQATRRGVGEAETVQDSQQKKAQEPDTENPIASENIASEPENIPCGSNGFETPTTALSIAKEEVTRLNVEALEHAPGPPVGSPGASTEAEVSLAGPTVLNGSSTPLPSPVLPLEISQRKDIQGDEPMSDEIRVALVPEVTTPKTTARSFLDAMQQSSITVNSSPLSSPPQILFDPYQDLSSSPPCSSDQSSNLSSRSQSEDPTPASTPLLTSQSSFTSSSGRLSLPNLKGKDLFDAQIWSDPTATSVFYTFITTLRQKARDVSPTSSHHFLGVLRDSRKLVRCYTQNIDQLEERAGLSTSLGLGAGSRYRFSVRAGRQSGGARGKEAESFGQSQGEAPSQAEEPLDGAPPAAPGLSTADASSGHLEVGDNNPDSRARPGLSNPPASAGPSSSQATDPPAPNRGVECVCLHGSLAELRCFLCGRTSSWDEDEREISTLGGQQPACPHCAGATAAREERGKRALGVGRLRPDIVLYGEEHPHSHLISPIVQHDLSLNPDMLLILGTSMRVHGLKVLVREFAKSVHNKGGKVVFVNFTKPAESVWADIIDYWIQSDCDSWVDDLQKRKPALWLPLGSVVEEDALKLPKARRSSTSQAKAKRRKSDDEVKRRESQGVAKVKPESSGSSTPAEIVAKTEAEPAEIAGEAEAAVAETSNTALSQLDSPKPVSFKDPAAKRRADPKLNWNAKRPAAVREHKSNGAWLMCNILTNLKRITGGKESGSVASSPAVKAEPKVKRPRKSAPAALQSGQDGLADPILLTTPSATAKAAKRTSKKRSLVESDAAQPKEIDLHHNNDRQPPQQPSPRFSMAGRKEIKTKTSKLEKSGGAQSTLPTKGALAGQFSPVLGNNRDDEKGEADDSIRSTVKGRKRKRTAWKIINGVETRVALSDGEADTPKNLATLPKKAKAPEQAAPPQTPPLLPHPRPSPIASEHQINGPWGQNSEPVPRNLPPLDIARTSPRSGPKIGQLEPPVSSPVERMRILARVSVPHPSTRIPNPFSIQQPLISHFTIPHWMTGSGEQPRQRQRQQAQAEDIQTGIGRTGPEEGRDEEAAMALSMLHRGAPSMA